MIRRLAVLFAALVLLPAAACDPDGGTPKRAQPTTAPTGTAASAVSTTVVRVAWTDTTPYEAGFEVFYRPSGGGAWTSWGTVAADVLTADVGGLAPSTSYEFQVTAYNALGPSAPSPAATASTRSYGWTRLPDAPLATRGARSAFDSLGNRMIVYGGLDDALTSNDELWALDLAAASPSPQAITPATSARPGFRIQTSLVYDPLRHRVLLFGGQRVDLLDPIPLLPMNDLWQFDLSPPSASNPDGLTWVQLGPGGTPPVARYGHSAIFDPVNDRMIVFGGFDDSAFLDDAARIHFSAGSGPTWESLTVSGSSPIARSLHTAVHDAPNQRMIVFGGYDNSGDGGGPYANDLWSLPCTAATTISWIPLTSVAGTPPTPREGHAAVYDSVNGQMVVFGGRDEGSGNPDNRVWRLSLDGSLAWAETLSGGTLPSARAYSTAVFDPGRCRMIAWTGELATGMADLEVWSFGL